MQFLRIFMNLCPSSNYPMSSFAIVSLCLVAFRCNLSTTDAIVQLPENVTVPAIYSFGDSTIDSGNNNYIPSIVRSNFPPYGRDFPGGNATGRFCNGKITSDFMVEELGIKELMPPYLDPTLTTNDLATGVTFASSGAGLDPATTQLASAISLEDQLNMFKELKSRLKTSIGEKEEQRIVENSVYFISVGSDDLANTYFHTTARYFQYDVDTYTTLLVNAASSFMQELISLGARRIGVSSLAPLGCLPSQRTLGGGPGRECVDAYNQAAEMFNGKIEKEILRLQNFNDSQVRLVYLDLYNPTLDLINNPKKYGFEVANRGCCGTGLIEVAFMCNDLVDLITCNNASQFVFWDSYHPSSRAYQILVQETFPSGVCPLLAGHPNPC